MSRINNTNPPGRGKELTSTALNQVFTEVNDAFPMDADNVRNEGLDQPAFDLDTNDGKSGIILVAADEDQNTSSVIVHANEKAISPYDPPTIVHTWSLLQTYATDQIMRVYWQFENETYSSSYTAVPITPDTNATGWAVWLEWQLSSGGAWTPVPNQSDFEDILVSPATHGASTLDTYGCTIVNHVFIHSHGGTTRYDEYPSRTGYGSWIYKADQDYVIFGLRLMCRGLIQNFYNNTPVNPPKSNAWELVDAASSTHQITIDASHIAYMIMEEQ